MLCGTGPLMLCRLLFCRYTSGSTGRPKGVLHSTGELPPVFIHNYYQHLGCLAPPLLLLLVSCAASHAVLDSLPPCTG